MKKIIFSLMVLLVFTLRSYAQSSPTDSIANQIAQKMKDSLSLTSEQTTQIYNLNTTLNNKEARLQKTFSGSKSLPYYLHLLGENRDSLYKSALPNDKYLLYLSKKQNINSGY